jgi:hypothetical protein
MIALLFALSVGLAFAAPAARAPPAIHGNQQSDFDSFISRFNLNYHANATEYHHRFSVFQNNIDFINQHNALYASGQETYVLHSPSCSAAGHMSCQITFSFAQIYGRSYSLCGHDKVSPLAVFSCVLISRS